MENEEVTRVLSPKAKRIIAIILAVALLAGGGYLWWFLSHYRFYTAYKSIVEAPEEYAEGQEFAPLKDELKAVPGYKLAAENDAVEAPDAVEASDATVKRSTPIRRTPPRIQSPAPPTRRTSKASSYSAT